MDLTIKTLDSHEAKGLWVVPSKGAERWRRLMSGDSAEPVVSGFFVLSFGKRSHELSIQTFMDVLDGIATLSNESARAVEPGLEVGLKVGPPQEGSFEIQLFVTGPELLELAKPLLTIQGAQFTAAIITAISGLLTIRKHLKGEPPKMMLGATETGDIVVENSTGVSITVDRRIMNVYASSRAVQGALDKTFESLDADPEIESFAVKGAGGKELFGVTRKELPSLKTAELIEAPPQEKVTTAEEVLHIVKPSFMPGLKWDFIFKGERITAHVKDKGFMAKIDAGEQFGKGDRLSVDLRVVQAWDQTLDTFVNRSYEITHVHSHEKRPRLHQIELGDDAP